MSALLPLVVLLPLVAAMVTAVLPARARPVTTIGTMPPPASSFRPWPSSVEKALKVSPSAPM